MADANAPAALPLISLQPVTDAEHGWVALLLRADAMPDEATLARLFDDSGLANALDGLICVTPVFGRTTADTTALLVKPVPAAMATDGNSSVQLPAICDAAGPCLALGVDTYSTFERCHKAGFTWFAGNYPLQPMPGAAARNAARHALVLELLTLITHDADTPELENLIKRDPQLSYQLLRLVNSVAFSPSQQITSFSHAITILGRKPMQRWLQLLLYARPDNAGRSPLLPRAAMRAAFMEALFATGSTLQREQAFMVGMFSLLEVMFNEKIAKLLAPLHLPGDVNRALIEGSGPLGIALKAVVAAETQPSPPAEALAAAEIDVARWTRALVGACHWSVRVSREA